MANSNDADDWKDVDDWEDIDEHPNLVAPEHNAIPQNPTQSGILSTGEGAALGLLPNIYAGIRAAEAKWKNPGGPSLGDNYDAAKIEYDNTSKKIKEGQPSWADAAGKFGGSSLSLGAGLLAKPATLGRAGTYAYNAALSGLANFGFGRGGSLKQNAADATGIQHALDFKQDISDGQLLHAAGDAIGLAGSPVGMTGIAAAEASLAKPTTNALVRAMDESRAGGTETIQKARDFFKAQEAASSKSIPGKLNDYAKRWNVAPGKSVGGVQGDTEVSAMEDDGALESVETRQARQASLEGHALRRAYARIQQGLGNEDDHSLVNNFQSRNGKLPGLSDDPVRDFSEVRRVNSGRSTDILPQEDILGANVPSITVEDLDRHIGSPARTVGGDDGSTTPSSTLPDTNPERPASRAVNPGPGEQQPTSAVKPQDRLPVEPKPQRGSPPPRPMDAAEFDMKGNPIPRSGYNMPGEPLPGENANIRNAYMKSLSGDVVPPMNSPLYNAMKIGSSPKQIVSRYVLGKLGLAKEQPPIFNDFNKAEIYENLARKSIEARKLSPQVSAAGYGNHQVGGKDDHRQP